MKITQNSRKFLKWYNATRHPSWKAVIHPDLWAYKKGQGKWRWASEKSGAVISLIFGLSLLKEKSTLGKSTLVVFLYSILSNTRSKNVYRFERLKSGWMHVRYYIGKRKPMYHQMQQNYEWLLIHVLNYDLVITVSLF